MLFFYSLVIKAYGLLISLVASFHPKAKLLSKGRKSQTRFIKEEKEQWGNHKVIWIHAASYGEYEMAKPIVRQLEKDPNLKFVISFHSPSGYEHTEFTDERFLKIYLPLDLAHRQAALIDVLKPDKVVFIKYEFWFNLLAELSAKGIPYYFTSLHLNASSYLFKKPFRPLLKLIKKSTAIFCHNTNSLEILKKNGFENAQILGDTRIAQALKTKAANTYNFHWKKKNKVCIALGSIIPSEYESLAQVINTSPDRNFLIAPHEIDSASISKLTDLLTRKVSLYSQAKENKPHEAIVIVDTLGDLKYLYKFCDLAYVGAGFEKGPHNVLESMVYGLPTICGPNIEKFPMAQWLASNELLAIAGKKQDIARTIAQLSNSDLKAFKAKASHFFETYPDNMDNLIKELSS